MVSPAIALRFRDTTPGVDTIQAHTDIIAERDSVWWGWWKKDFEADNSQILREVNGSLEVLIVDRSTHRMFLANCVESIIGSDEPPDLSLVPLYYRESAKQVYGWIRLVSIQAVDYQEEIAAKFGDGTLIVIGSIGEEPAPAKPKIPDIRGERSSILHLSDLHFGPDYDFLLQREDAQIGVAKRTLTDCILDDLNRVSLSKDIEAIIITGDFTSHGDWGDQMMNDIVEELTALKNALGIKDGNLLALPGNHDVDRYPKGQEIDPAKLSVDNQTTYKHERDFRFFLSRLSGRDVMEPLNYNQKILLQDTDLFVGILNSCRILATEWTEYGYVGPSGLGVLAELAANQLEHPTFRIMAMHHHLLPVTDVEAPNKMGVTLSLDASIILETAQANGIQVALHGHQHTPHLARYQAIPLMGKDELPPITIVSNGSTGVSATRRPGGERNTYCVLTFSKDDIILKMRELRSDGKEGNVLFDRGINIKPFFPN